MNPQSKVHKKLTNERDTTSNCNSEMGNTAI